MHPTLLLLEFVRRPAPQAEAAIANYNSNVLCSKSLSSAGVDDSGNGFVLSADQQNRGAVVAFHEHNLLPFSTPQSYALLSAESKATEAANNEERLVVCHYIVWCRTVLKIE